ncbi:GlsB/YeaQ/YmgE family stress response membrane protein [Bremerella sp. JC770]|uniref:GlsB/YeaQ/YmgE family stress response membrane protein n=1 Tax=Bremerella sp. JC770 TaxID=3232137 RepID=UPI00345AD70D
MGVISWIVFGLIAGALAKFLFPGDDPGGCIVTIIIGIVGATVGGFIATGLGYGSVTGFNLYSFGVAILGSMVVLAIYRVLIGGKTE